MVRKLLQTMYQLRAFVMRSEKQQEKLLNCNGSPGSRATPPPVHDAKLGARVNYGRKIMVDGVEHQQYHLLLNTNAEDRAIRELERVHPNKKWATATIPTNANDREEDMKETLTGIFDDFEDDINSDDDNEDDTEN